MQKRKEKKIYSKMSFLTDTHPNDFSSSSSTLIFCEVTIFTHGFEPPPPLPPPFQQCVKKIVSGDGIGLYRMLMKGIVKNWGVLDRNLERSSVFLA